MKRLIVAIICFSVIFSGSNIYAYEYPSAFWSVNSKYETAVNANNYGDIIRYGTQETDMLAPTSDSREKRNTMVTRYNQVGLAYAAIGDYDNSARTFNQLYNYANQFGTEFYDYIKSSKARALQYTSAITMYTDGGVSPYYGAKNEKKNGVLFGTCSNGKTRSKLKNESMVLIYQELGQQLLTYNIGVIKDAAEKGIAVEFALNCPKEANDIRNIKNMSSYLKELSDLFKKYPDTPFYLRFAAEFDIWENLSDAESYRSAFRYVSQYFKDRNSNVALVWSPNQVSNWNIDIDDYYPGDGYVDWVGISSYAQKYFLGDKNQTEENSIVFKAGTNSDPVLAVKDVVERYGNRKPIMLSEFGCSHTVTKTGENTSSFALRRLNEYLSYLPMVYPQIKLMAYFDWYVDGEVANNSLSENAAMQTAYLTLTKGDRFIQDKFSNDAGICYRPIVDNMGMNAVFPVSCYAHKYNDEAQKVTYYIDGTYVGASAELPFTAYVDASNYSGRHTLRAVAEFSSGATMSTETAVNIYNPGNRVTVKISDRRISFDREPIIYNDRTMVPMRKIFEELGANVSWDDSTRTAMGKKGDRTVKITVGSKKMYVNSKEITLDTSAIILSDRTLVPVRAIAEGLGCDVDWNGNSSTVYIEPKIFNWSAWTTELPDDVDNDLFYIEKKDEYRYRTREKEEFSLSEKNNALNYVRDDSYYGNWGDWQNDYISASDTREVETRTQSSPMMYHYAHYCTGNIADASDRYKTWDHSWRDECDYHDLGWYDYPLPQAPDGNGGYILYNDDGSKYNCSNYCWRWYVMETSGGNYTQYRSREVYHKYIYWQWSDWSRWSDWSDENPRNYNQYADDISIEKRTVYRYKEK